MTRRNASAFIGSPLAMIGFVFASVMVPHIASAQADAPALFVIRGSFFNYGWLGQGSVTDTFGPSEGSFGVTYEFDDGGATDRSIVSEIDLVGNNGKLAVDLSNEARLRAPRLGGNDHGGGFTTVIDVYVKAPPSTPFYVDRFLVGSVTAVRGGGLGTTHAAAAGVIASVTNGSGAQSLPVAIDEPRAMVGSTTSTTHPSVPGYHLATSYSLTEYGFTFQSLDFCFPSCPTPLNFRSTSELSGYIAAGPCCPQTAEETRWNDNPLTQSGNNCYNYATNRLNDRFEQPGGLSPSEWTCALAATGASADGIPPVSYGDPNSCGPGQCAVALVVAPSADNANRFNDYHWYRRNADGTWSHKPGATPATNVDTSGVVITNPETADRRFPDGPDLLPGYTQFCGYYCVPCEFNLPGAGPSGEPPRLTPAILATLDFYSGRTNPQWEVVDADSITLIASMLFAGEIISPTERSSAFGYSGFALEPVGGLAGLPDRVDAYDGVIRIIDNGVAEYRTDVFGLEEFLRQLADEAGYGMLLPSTCVADYNGTPDSGDIIDFLDFIQDFSDCTNLPAPCGQFGDADINGDTIIDILDFLDFIEAFSAGC